MVAATTQDKRKKIHALSLAKECYSMKLDLLTNATVVNDAMRFVSEHSSDNNKKKLISEGENSEESKEPDYDEKDSNKPQVKKQEGKRREKRQTANKIF